jgi:2-keto-4-pentenoate hydratase/2-oxohepta-3-ene-1,7-dioic acid hydratase in catechol pathway
MRLCRFRDARQRTAVGFYFDDHVVPLSAVAAARTAALGESTVLPIVADLRPFLPPDGEALPITHALADFLAQQPAAIAPAARLALDRVDLLVPIAQPRKLFLLAGNYAKHIEEGGGQAAERAETFPYVFMKPPSTTLNHPGKSFALPAVSPAHIDWELELAVVIGRRCKQVSEREALDYVAGYTIINDISDRQFRPNPQRKERPRDAFFDWLHGKWHDGSCPCGPCLATAEAVPDPQQLQMQLKVNGQVYQDASTAQQIFPVAALIEFISSFVTLEPGDIISTGTPHGVGKASNVFLRPGDRIEATISSIGTLVTLIE